MEAKIDSGICGFKTRIQVENGEKYQAKLLIESDCPHVRKMSENLGTLNAMNELFKRGQSQIIAQSVTLPHVTCPVPIGMLKILEASTGLALPKDSTITITK